MSGKWTPGPWEFEPETEHHGAYVTALMAGTVCDCYWINRHGDLIHHAAEAREYNARLIAQSPVMADVLEAMVERFGHDIFTMPQADRDLLTRAVDVLARAKGEGA